jgi:hypothetical protein
MKPSEVLAEALAFWGQGGERWMVEDLGDTSSACLVGGISYAIAGEPLYYKDLGVVPEMQDLYVKAMTYVYDELEAQGYYSRRTPGWEISPSDLQESLIQFNDHDCLTYDEDDDEYAGRVENFPKLRGVVCNALKRALEAEANDESE